MKRLLPFVLLISMPIAVLAQAPQKLSISHGSAEIGKLIHLKQAGDRMAICWDYWEFHIKEKNEQQELEEEIAALIKQGMNKEMAERVAEHKVGRGHATLTEIPHGYLFNEIKKALGAQSGGGGGGGGDWHWNGHGNGFFLSMSSNTQGNFVFSIQEKAAPFTKFLVDDHIERGLRFEISDNDGVMLFWQTNDGKVRVAETSEKQTAAFQADSYDEMAQEHPEFAEALWEKLNSFGVNKILTVTDSRVVSEVARRIMPNDDSAEEFKVLLTQLGDDSYEKRKAASEKLVKNATVWKSAIKTELSKSDLDSEVRLQLRVALTKSMVRPTAIEKEIADLIESEGLLDDAEYLSSIVEECHVESQPLIRDRIQELGE